MNKFAAILLASLWFANAAFPQQPAGMPAREISFDSDWRFHDGDAPGADKPGFDDSAWRHVDVPHDYAIEGAFDIHSPAGGGGGYLDAGVAWYRKTFTVPASQKGMHFTVMFDGVYMNADVYLNGAIVCNHPYGYTSFYHDITDILHYDGTPNVLSVRVNVRQPSSRWYSGAGIYRHVHLIATNPVHVEPWDFTVTTPKIEDGKATVLLATKVSGFFRQQIQRLLEDSGGPARRRPSPAPAASPAPDFKLTVVNTIIDPDGKEIFKQPAMQDPQVRPDITNDIFQFFEQAEIANPRLWSPETPALYRAKSEVMIGGKVVDTVETSFGIRSIAFTPDGFFLNGKPYPIRGVCDHHDLGCLGSAAYRRGIERQLEILKTIGCNAIRTSHNPPSPELLDLCDSMGFLVMDEAFDEWKQNKTQFGYSEFFDNWSKRDLESMVRRDRNHPSVILWSIGNEIPEQGSPDGGKMAARLAEIVRHEDPTRPVTSACNAPDQAVDTGFAGALDVLGINYNTGHYTKLKGRPLFGSETASAISSRGEYNLLPGKDGNLEIKAEYNHQMSSYDTEAPGWATKVESSLTALRDCPWVAGQFVWTGFDYIGEPTPFGWPSRSSYFGIFDTCGFPKDRAYLYQSQWTTKPMVHILPHWNWEGYEGKEIPVRCYTNADSVELFLNDKSLGVRDWKDNKTLHLEWKVPYAPGVLKAVATKDGKVVATDEVHTAGPPAKIELTADRPVIAADSDGLSFITARILDKDGNLCPNAANALKFDVAVTKVMGFASASIEKPLELPLPCKLLATDNGDPTDTTSFQSPVRKAFHGMALAVLRYPAPPGEDVHAITGDAQNQFSGPRTILLTATADGLSSATVTLVVLPSADASAP